MKRRLSGYASESIPIDFDQREARMFHRDTFWITPRGLWNLLYCDEVLIVDYMEKNWRKPEDVLTYLLNSPSMRRHLKSVSAFAKSDDSGTTFLVHPLLQPPIYLEEDHDDLKF